MILAFIYNCASYVSRSSCHRSFFFFMYTWSSFFRLFRSFSMVK